MYIINVEVVVVVVVGGYGFRDSTATEYDTHVYRMCHHRALETLSVFHNFYQNVQIDSS